MGCRHRRTTHLRWQDGAWGGTVHGVNCQDWIGTTDGAVVCKDCGAWVSLGPAREDERTAIELDAAYVASRWDDSKAYWLAVEAMSATDGRNQTVIELAREIVEHDHMRLALDGR